MFKLRYFTILCTTWAHFKFNDCYRSQNSWDRGMFTMASPLLFKTVWRHLGIKVMSLCSFGCWNLVPFLSEIGFQQQKSLWSSLTYFSYNDAANVLSRWKIWTAGRTNSAARTLLLRSHAFVIAAVCGLHCPAEIDVIWRGAYVALKPLYTFQHS